MATEMPVAATTPEEVEDVVVVVEEPILPFDTLDDQELKPLRSGPRFSSTNANPQLHYGPVTIRNYMAGEKKRSTRKSQTCKNASVAAKVFPKLPVELQLLVLEYLHPLELYQMSQVSKAFRRLVMNPKAVGVWKVAFDLNPDLPKPPPRVRESQWAFMLYGPGICGECGGYGALTDFSFLKRYCEFCIKDHCGYINSFKDTCGNALTSDHIVWSLLPRSYRYMGMRHTTAYVSASNAKFLCKDVEPMVKKVTLLQLLIDNEVPRIMELFEDYKQELVAHISAVNECANKARDWAMDVYRRCASEYDVLYQAESTVCKKRLKNLGHEAKDIEHVSYSLTLMIRQGHVHKLNPKAFRALRPRMEVLVQNRKETRLKTERLQLLESIYKDYQKSLTPDEWQYLPPGRLVKDIEGFSEFKDAPYDKRGDMAPGYAAQLFPAFIADWTRSQQLETLKLFPQPEGFEEPFETRLKRLDLATSVVTCMGCKYTVRDGWTLLGWKSICRHRRNNMPGFVHPCSTYEVNDNAVAAAASLVSCVGLDPSTATIEEMNARNDRFMCGNCMAEDGHGVRGLKAYTWVECIRHALEMSIANDVMHNAPAWLLLTPEATRFVREHEGPYPNKNLQVWRCNHCAENFEGPKTQIEVISHVAKVHCIKEAVVGVDVVPDLRRIIRQRHAFRLGLDPAFECRCKHCPEMRIYKLWELQALKTHLRTKHQVLEPVENTDWTNVKIIAAAAASAPTKESTDVDEQTPTAP